MFKIRMSMVCILVYCILPKRFQKSSWLSRMKNSGVGKNSQQKLMFHNNWSNGDKTNVFTCMSSTFQYLQNGANIKTIYRKTFMLEGNEHSTVHCKYICLSALKGQIKWGIWQCIWKAITWGSTGAMWTDCSRHAIAQLVQSHWRHAVTRAV